ncbi:MAG TPA: flagellar motor stator protein MotA [Alphaproteobacteria bacterium]|nr:flagellar motor stator protein MotA [Alphaproteobacteria bacterium]
MLVLVGIVVVLGSVFGGFLVEGGNFKVLIQPAELLIIAGAAAGAFLISNPKQVIGKVGKAISHLLKGPRYGKESYLELLSLLYQIFKIAKTKGMLSLEQHVENPGDSTLFQQFPKFCADKAALTFLCDYLRLLTLGTDKAHEIEALIDEEIETHHHEHAQVATALQTSADGMPALGIVAAVLGVINTMGSINQPPAILGHLIAAALVGTFLGVLLSYGFVGPIGHGLGAIYDAELKYFHCIKAGLLAHMQGYAPAISVEFARKALLSNVRPTFYEVEEATAALPPAA